MSLKRSAASGVTWTGASTVVTTTLQFLQTVVLARLLSPTAFGLMAMVVVVQGLAQSYAEMGLSSAIVYHQKATRNELSSLYWTSLVAGIVVYGVVIAATPLITLLFGEPRLRSLLYFAGLTFVIMPIGQQFQTLLEKELKFKPLALIDSVGAVAGVSTAITTAVLGQGVYSLIWGQLAHMSSKALLLLGIGLRRWPPRLHFRARDLKGYFSFGLFQVGARSVTYVNSTLDKVLIGSLLGAQALGYYNLAWNLAIQPISRINPIITRVAFPLFAKIQLDTVRLKKGYLFVLRVISTLDFPLLFGLVAVAPTLVPTLFGAKWIPSITALQLLGLVAVFRSIANPTSSLLLAKGRADMTFYWNLSLLAAQFTGALLGAHFAGITGVAISLLGLQGIYVVFSYRFLIRAVLGPCAREYLFTILPTCVIASAMAFAVSTMTTLHSMNTTTLLAVQILTGMTLYIVLMAIFQRTLLREIMPLIRSPQTA